MIKKLLLKISSLLYKIHLYINGLFKEKSSFVPYTLQYHPATSEIKIVHINGNFLVGGTSQLIVDIIERTSHKYAHSVIVPHLPNPIPYQPLSIHKFSIEKMAALLAFLKKENPTLVHIHYWVRHIHRYEDYAFWYEGVFRICEELKLRVIQNINVPTTPYHSPTILHNVFVSNYVQENFNNANTTPSSVVYPGSDFYHFKNEDLNSLPDNTIGMVYRLDKDKLNPEAIEVFIAVAKRKPDIQCYIIGKGYYFEYYKKRVAEEQLDKNFVFAGVVSYKSLPDWYKKISVFVAPVHDESFGQVTPFAMSMGLSIAGYDTGALSEVLGYDHTLVEYGNTEALANVIIALVNNREKRMELGRVNRERAHQCFSVEQMINQYEKLYDEYTR